MSRTWLYCQAVALLLCALPALARNDYQNRPVRLIVPYPAGAGTDIIARPAAEALSRGLGQQFVVEHRGGAGGTLGTEAVAKSTPDGYTLLFTPQAPIVVLPNLRKLGYDPLKDLKPVARVGEVIGGFAVHPSLGVRTLLEFVSLSKHKPGKISFVLAGTGTVTHLRGEMLRMMAGIDLLHVPYRGNGEALPDLLAGNVHSMFEAIVFPHVKAGKLVLLVIIDDQRHPEFPDVPTIKEAGYPDYDLPIWFGVYAPAATLRPVVERLHDELAKLATDEALRARRGSRHSSLQGR